MSGPRWCSPRRRAAPLLDAARQQDVSKGGVYCSLPVGIQVWDRPWDSPDAPGEAVHLGSVDWSYDTPVKHYVTIYRAMVTADGVRRGREPPLSVLTAVLGPHRHPGRRRARHHAGPAGAGPVPSPGLTDRPTTKGASPAGGALRLSAASRPAPAGRSGRPGAGAGLNGRGGWGGPGGGPPCVTGCGTALTGGALGGAWGG